MTQKSKQVRNAAVGVLIVSLWLIFSPSSGGQELAQATLRTFVPDKISLEVGKSLVIDTPRPIKRVSLANPEIADTVVISPQQVYLTGKALGTTNLTLWAPDDRVFKIFDLAVSPDLSQLKEKLQEILPGENLRVVAAHDSITLAGEVSSTANLSHALAVTEAFAPKTQAGAAKVVNLAQVTGVHQVMLEVRVAEMSRSLGRRLGFNFTYATEGGAFGASVLNNLTPIVRPIEAELFPLRSRIIPDPKGSNPPFGQVVTDVINALFRIHNNGASWTGFFDALKENGLVKILAEPTLVTLSGQEATFLAGGEFPIPVPQEAGAIGITFKPFGVGLSFTPTVLNNNKISMRVAPEVSDLDFSTAIFIGGIAVPGLTTRRASTVIELGDGQSFAIAGLLRENVRELVAKFPLLGDIPIIGALFRSTSFQKNETELIIIVTPHLVKPLDMAKQTLPTDKFIEPNDFEWYLLGQVEGMGGERRRSQDVPLALLRKTAGFEGEFGYIIP